MNDPCRIPHDLSVILVNWNAREYLRNCLQSLRASMSSVPRGEVIVVDNASSDGSAEMVQAEFPEVRLIVSEENRGFAAANNRGLREAQGRYLLLLNPDTEVRPGAMEALVQFLDEHPQAGAVGPQLLNPDGSLQPSGRRLPTLGRYLIEVTGLYRLWTRDANLDPRRDYSQVAEVEELSGAALAIRREVLETVGFLDEGFFLLFEDLDWCRRMRQAGWHLYYVPSGQVLHHWGGSRRQGGQVSYLAALASAHYYFRKHHGRFAAAAVKGVLLAREGAHLMKALACGLIRPREDRWASLRFHWRAWKKAGRLPQA